MNSSPLLPKRTPQKAAAELLRRRHARRNLLEFTCYTKPDYETSWHHAALCSFLDRFVRGEITRGIVCMPPQHGKSELTSRRLPAYLLGRDPAKRLICCSHTADLASAMNRDVQRIMDSREYHRLFPGTCLGADNVRSASGAPLRNSEMFELPGHKGYYKCAGVGGSIVGRGFDVGIIDDPVKKREEADSPTVRESNWNWYTGDFYTRRGPGASILIIMTRWHEEDLVGRLLKLQEDDPRADRWEVLTLPAVKEQPPSELDPREVGEALWPARYPLEDLAKVEAGNPYEWWSQYQQHPRAPGSVEWPDSYFPRSIWFEDWPELLLLKAMSLDPSKGKDAKHGDYSAWLNLGLDRRGHVWVDADLQRRATPKIVEDGIAHFRRHNPSAIVIEINQFQELFGSIFTQRAKELTLRLPLYGINNMVKKEIRIRTLGPYLSRGEIHFRNTPGTRLLVQQLRNFPVGDHDDGPDALEMGIRLLLFLLGQKSSLGQPQILRA